MVKNSVKAGNEMIQIATPFLGEEEWLAVKEPLLSGWLTQGPKVKGFEEAFSQKHNVSYSLAVTSCTTALHLALLAVGVQAGDWVLLPSFTWIATANVVEYCGAHPVFCDSDYETYNIDPVSLRENIEKLLSEGKKPKAIIAVHLFGLCANMDEIKRIAVEFGLKVIEDAACAAGAQYKGEMAGSLGDIGCFSFHPRKVITTGEGGMCTTNSSDFAEIMNCLRNHGASLSEEKRHVSSKPYIMPDFNVLGYNYRMTDVQGAIGLIQLTRLDDLITERQKWAEFYQQELQDLEWITTPKVAEGYFHTFQAYVCTIDENKVGKTRDAIMEILMQNGIHTRPGTHAIHELGYYQSKYKLEPSHCVNASKLAATTIALPLHNNMSQADFQRVVRILKEIH